MRLSLVPVQWAVQAISVKSKPKVTESLLHLKPNYKSDHRAQTN